jgi:hypothetical protein
LQKHLQTIFPLFLTLLFVHKLCTIFDHTCSDLLNVPYICDSDVKCAISHLLSTKSVGPDEIPIFLIKGCSDVFIHLLRHIFNLSLSTGKFPSLWKQAAVVPIFKKGNRVLVVNYRPTSILNNFSKIFESTYYT